MKPDFMKQIEIRIKHVACNGGAFRYAFNVDNPNTKVLDAVMYLHNHFVTGGLQKIQCGECGSLTRVKEEHFKTNLFLNTVQLCRCNNCHGKWVRIGSEKFLVDIDLFGKVKKSIEAAPDA